MKLQACSKIITLAALGYTLTAAGTFYSLNSAEHTIDSNYQQELKERFTGVGADLSHYVQRINGDYYELINSSLSNILALDKNYYRKDPLLNFFEQNIRTAGAYSSGENLVYALEALNYFGVPYVAYDLEKKELTVHGLDGRKDQLQSQSDEDEGASSTATSESIEESKERLLHARDQNGETLEELISTEQTLPQTFTILYSGSDTYLCLRLYDEATHSNYYVVSSYLKVLDNIALNLKKVFSDIDPMLQGILEDDAVMIVRRGQPILKSKDFDLALDMSSKHLRELIGVRLIDQDGNPLEDATAITQEHQAAILAVSYVRSINSYLVLKRPFDLIKSDTSLLLLAKIATILLSLIFLGLITRVALKEGQGERQQLGLLSHLIRKLNAMTPEELKQHLQEAKTQAEGAASAESAATATAATSAGENAATSEGKNTTTAESSATPAESQDASAAADSNNAPASSSTDTEAKASADSESKNAADTESSSDTSNAATIASADEATAEANTKAELAAAETEAKSANENGESAATDTNAATEQSQDDSATAHDSVETAAESEHSTPTDSKSSDAESSSETSAAAQADSHQTQGKDKEAEANGQPEAAAKEQQGAVTQEAGDATESLALQTQDAITERVVSELLREENFEKESPVWQMLSAIVRLAQGLEQENSKQLDEIKQEFKSRIPLYRKEGQCIAARQMLLSAMPSEEAMPSSNFVDFAAFTVPARDLSGNFYTIQRLDDDNLAFVIGDCESSGTKAAYTVAVVSILVSEALKLDLDPPHVMQYLNERLCNIAHISPVSLFIGMISEKTGNVIAANAGHCVPIVVDDTGPHFVAPFNEQRLGLDKEQKFELIKWYLANDDMVVLYSKGILNVKNVAGEIFGMDRLLDHCVGANTLRADELVIKILNDIKQHKGKRPFREDVSLICLKQLHIRF